MPYIGEIRIHAGSFNPNGWLWCEGQELPISEYDSLFTLIGTTYGGDGESTFALPDLRGRLPIHRGDNYVLAQTGGVEQVTLTLGQIPAHSHAPLAAAVATTADPTGQLWAHWQDTPYSTDNPDVVMHPGAIGPTGGSQPHSNVPPYLSIGFIISLFGDFPSPT